MKIETLRSLISKYFDAQTTLEEEQVILKEALKLEGNDPMIDEVLAVMGYARRNPPKNKMTKAFSIKWKWVSIAAAIIMLSIVGISYINTDHNLNKSDCYAYIDGVRIENQMKITSLIQEQLSEISYAKINMENDISKDLEEIATALNFESL